MSGSRQVVLFEDLGTMEYKQAWDYQELLLRDNVEIKSTRFSDSNGSGIAKKYATKNFLLFVEHPPVFTLGKSGRIENVLISEDELRARNIQFFKTNRGGDITFHGWQQLVGYPILDLEHFYTDIGRYLRNIEEVIIKALKHYNIHGERSSGETGVWLEPGVSGRARKICAIGVRCSRWVTMHGFAFNVNTDLSYFDLIVPCGIRDKQVTSVAKELGKDIPIDEVKNVVRQKFEEVFDVDLEGVEKCYSKNPWG